MTDLVRGNCRSLVLQESVLQLAKGLLQTRLVALEVILGLGLVVAGHAHATTTKLL